MTYELKPCPACGSKALVGATVIVCADHQGCALLGPCNDPDGAKWNALPRRGTGAEMEELRAALAAWRAYIPDESSYAGAMRVRNAIDAVLAAAGDDEAWLRAALTTKEAASAEIGSLRATVEQLTKERDEALNKAAVLGQEVTQAHNQIVQLIAEASKLRQQIAALKELVREFAREGKQ